MKKWIRAVFIVVFVLSSSIALAESELEKAFVIPVEESRIIQMDLDDDGMKDYIEVEETSGSGHVLNIKVKENGKVVFEKQFYKGVIEKSDTELGVVYPVYDSNDLPNAFYDRLERVKLGRINGEWYFSKPEEVTREIKIKSSDEFENPTREEIEGIIEQVAINRDIPPVILKSIAYAESGLTQYRDGKPLVSFDGGYGVMQVTPSQSQIDDGIYDIVRLMHDLKYNIETGADILLSKWGYALGSKSVIPKIEQNDPNILESWYFTIWAYNGWSMVNHPNAKDLWNKPYAYQERVLDIAEKEYGQKISAIDLDDEPVDKLPDKTKVFKLPNKVHEGGLVSYNWGDLMVCRANLNIRDPEDNWKVIDVLDKGTNVKLVDEPVLKNGYRRYQIAYYKHQKLVAGWVAVNWLDKEYIEYSDLDYYVERYFDEDVGRPEKTWQVEFNDLVNVDTLMGKVSVAEIRNGKLFESVPVIAYYGDNDKTAAIFHDKPYEPGKEYALIIEKEIKSMKGKNLDDPLIFKFSIIK